MAGPGSTFTGPLISGPKFYADANGAANTGLCQLAQVGSAITQAGTAVVSTSFVLPPNSVIHDVIVDTTVAWNAGTSATFSLGATAGGTDYASGVDVKTAAGRARPTFTAAQLTAMLNIGNTTTVFATVTPAGTAPSAGSTTVTLEYIQTVENVDSNF
ncbi:MAG TPA: hypothetical protein VN692_17680 [Steroidobacteraceae bacterium]|nr:hypothetical protein [Steroidobacteraceae bacterium]